MSLTAAPPTNSIQFGDHDELRARTQEPVERLCADGLAEARLYA